MRDNQLRAYTSNWSALIKRFVQSDDIKSKINNKKQTKIKLKFSSMSSVTFYKYCGNGFGEERPLELGQKQTIIKDMEKNVQGYKVLRQEIKDLR